MRDRRHALVIGIESYPGFGPESQLAGAVRDAQIMAELLIERYSFVPDNVLRLFEAEATRGNILDALDKLRRRVDTGDQVLVFFSGHGSQMTDREGDEGDGLDETLVPCDSGRDDAENRDISDDEINHWAAGVLEVTPHLTLIFDCCHAGTIQRPGWRVRSVPPDLRSVDALPPSPVPTWRDVEIGPRPLMLAACRDDERALELPPAVAGECRGAFSFHLTDALRHAAPEASWREVFARAATTLKNDCPEQHPEASGDGLDAPIFGSRPSSPWESSPGDRLLELAARPNQLELSMKLFRSHGGAWRQAAESSFIEGDRLRVDVRHGHGRKIFVYLFDIGVTGVVTLLFPDREGHEVLDPGTVLTVGARRGDLMELSLPAGFPADRSSGVAHLVLVGAKERLSTARLRAGTARRGPGSDAAVSATAARYRLHRA